MKCHQKKIHTECVVCRFSCLVNVITCISSGYMPDVSSEVMWLSLESQNKTECHENNVTSISDFSGAHRTGAGRVLIPGHANGRIGANLLAL